MKKLAKTITALSGSAILLGACGNAEQAEEESFELNWSTTPSYSTQNPTESQANYIADKVSEFEEDYPQVELNTDLQSTDIDESMTRLLEQANTDRAPDVAAIDGYFFPRFMDYLQPLDDLFDEYEIDIDDYLPFVQDVLTGDDGQIYGLYMNTDTRVLFYDTDVVEEPPTTWDEAIATSLEIQEEGYNGLIFPGGRGEGTAVTTLWPLFWAQEGELVDEDGNPTFGEGDNYDKMLNVLQAVNEAVESGATPQRVSSYGGENDLNEEIAGGDTAMFLGGNWQVSFLRETLGDDFDSWAVAPLPQLEEGQFATSAGGWAWGIFAEEEEKQEAAFDLINRLFVGEEGMTEWTNVHGGLPSRTSIYEAEDLEAGEFSDTFREYLEDANVRPASQHYNEISNQMQIAVSEVISGGKSPEEALDDAWAVVNEGE
ncbi:extracellular solute-binding protein [Alkalicoccus daliensis]|uniref:Carbohydrate ABC transporter substrate-binding protein, CUT1 family n=1 Tax=Alkalicoccus daliensis TaxID=745820 RepID=A0A1H0HA16_9BACI|nr:extracellular solute-binding protein [Alkalicoccus daliensis]SDO15894.1 carbohydrate ABC transporter substrate-binding protein, CUT1 family [Alkalicoccus daliensis]